jgi:hypothetical protein
MPVQIVTDATQGNLKTVGLEGDPWKRIVIVVAAGSGLKINHPDGDPNKLLIEYTPPPPKP